MKVSDKVTFPDNVYFPMTMVDQAVKEASQNRMVLIKSIAPGTKLQDHEYGLWMSKNMGSVRLWETVWADFREEVDTEE